MFQAIKRFFVNLFHSVNSYLAYLTTNSYVEDAEQTLGMDAAPAPNEGVSPPQTDAGSKPTAQP